MGMRRSDRRYSTFGGNAEDLICRWQAGLAFWALTEFFEVRRSLFSPCYFPFEKTT